MNGKWFKKVLSSSIEEARRLRDDLLKEVDFLGEIQKPEIIDNGPLFGEFAEKWATVKSAQIKYPTMRDYKSSMNLYILPRFGNTPIASITYLDIERKTET